MNFLPSQNMLSHTLYFFLLLHIIFPTTTAAPSSAYTADDFILLNCGVSTTANDNSKRIWVGDEPSGYAPSYAATISSAATASYMDPSVFHVPYKTARIFHSPFTYKFPVSAGQKFLRLYFHPNIYSDDFDASQSFFSVTANGFTLLSNFSAFLHSRYFSELSFAKEFIINIQENQGLDLTFSPGRKSSAFVNGIEIVSIPERLYLRGNYVENNTALENLYRLKVGGSRVEIQDDSGPTRGMFRAWFPDEKYILGADVGYVSDARNIRINYTAETPPYSAPEIVYRTCRMVAHYSKYLKWAFTVDSGFDYMLRLHFCETRESEVAEQNQMNFTIYISNQTAEKQANLAFWTGGRGVPMFRDYITRLPDDGRRGKQELWLSLFSNHERGIIPSSNALLNGLEIFKLSDANRSLAAANPDLKTGSWSRTTKVKNKKSLESSAIYGSVFGVAAVVAAVSFLILWRRRKKNGSATTSKSWILISTKLGSTKRRRRPGALLPSDLCRYFSIDEIKTATRYFDDDYVIGKGGFGNVYKGYINGGAPTLAIKRLISSSNQGLREFLTEIEILSRLRHRNLVSLLGFCDEFGEMLLVYEYMVNGTLRSHLYNTENPPLTWKQRLQICLGAAKGLDYLHTGTEQAIIHRDVKTTNILLDENWVAKVSDFGLSKVVPAGGDHAHVSTVVKGSFGYVDPEYYRRQQLTNKSDVYSFGVVLFEVLCGRPPIAPALPQEEVNLADWAKFCFKEGRLEQIIESNLKAQIAPECLGEFAGTAVACLSDEGNDRPVMYDVVRSLESAKLLQDAAERRGGGRADCDGGCSTAPSVGLIELTRSEQAYESSSQESEFEGYCAQNVSDANGDTR